MPVTGRYVLLVCGPPGAGKSTYARSLSLSVMDRDDPQWRSDREFVAALRHIGRDHAARAVVIRSAPTLSSRRRVAEMVGASRVVVLEVPAAECIRRVTSRRRGSSRAQVKAVTDWWARYERGEVLDPVPLLTSRRWAGRSTDTPD